MNWLLLRGLGREKRHWGKFPQIFEQAAPSSISVMALDLPGAGDQSTERSPTSIAEIADHVRKRWLAVKPQGDWGVVGISLGGMVAMSWSARFATDFRAVVLINSSAANVQPPWARMRPQGLWMFARTLFDPDPFTRERRILDLTSGMLADPKAQAQKWVEIARQSPPLRQAILRQLMAAAMFRAPTRLSAPTLVVRSQNDCLVHPSCSEMLAQRLGAVLATHPGAGHDLPLDDPEWLSRAIHQWAAHGFPR